MKVSVIVTTYNNPSALKVLFEGLSQDRRLPDEAIVADDGSGPETEKAVREIALSSAFPVRHVWHEDIGFRAAKIRNEAIKSSTGQYLIFLDGDCVPNRHFVSDHIKLAEKGCFVQGKRVIVGRQAVASFNARDANRFFSLLKLTVTCSISNRHHLIRLPAFPAIRNKKLKGIKSCNMGMFRDDILAVNGFNEAFVGWGREDSELAVRLFRYGLRRKGHPFCAICFHLYHPVLPKDSLAINDALLDSTIKGGEYFCPNGIVKTHDRGN